MQQDKMPKLYSVGVMLDDNRMPPKLYEVDGYDEDGTLYLVLIDQSAKHRMYTRETHASNFWPLIDYLPRHPI